MSYRGDDLDLRVPQADPGEVALTTNDPFTAPSRTRLAAQTNRGAPIWVDDAVLECCNHAFDVAAAHRAGEVRLDHLIYALTRIDEAAELLETRGIRVAALRREAANAVATDFPSGTANGKTTPRRGDAFEEVLRIAASRAYRRQAPAGVGDIVYALFDSGVDFPGLFRLLPLNGPRPGVQQEASLSAEAVRERIRSAAAAPEPLLRAPDLAGLSTVQTSTQNSRLDAIEQSVRTLTIELANERKLISGVRPAARTHGPTRRYPAHRQPDAG
jgi:ATP-dependent Clp protease ATP-binding subunit ClpA